MTNKTPKQIKTLYFIDELNQFIYSIEALTKKSAREKLAESRPIIASFALCRKTIPIEYTRYPIHNVTAETIDVEREEQDTYEKI